MKGKKFTFVAAIAVTGVILVGLNKSKILPSKIKDESVVLSFNGDSKELKQTEIVPTLDSAAAGNRNIIWCATFQAAWKELQLGLLKGPVRIEPPSESMKLLNAAPDIRSNIPPEFSVIRAGWISPKFLEDIRKEKASKFPNEPPPDFRDVADDELLAYSFLGIDLPFPIAFDYLPKPMDFTDSRGNLTQVLSFGIGEHHRRSLRSLREEIQVLYASRNGKHFIIDPCKSSKPFQIVLAAVERKETLEALVEHVNKLSKSVGQFGQLPPFAFMQDMTLAVPVSWWKVEHHFKEFSGAFLKNEPFANRIGVAVQTTEFRLDRKGMKLASEAKFSTKGLGAGDYKFDRPFAIIVNNRNTGEPVFAMWVDNADLLQKWAELK